MLDADPAMQPVESAVVNILKDKVAIFRSNGIPGANEGDKLTISVVLDRRRKVVEARVSVEEEEIELTGGQLWNLLIAEPLFTHLKPEFIGIKIGEKVFTDTPAAKEAHEAAEAARMAAKENEATPKRTPTSIRSVALRARMRKSPIAPGPAANAEANANKEKADAWAASKQVDSELASLLEEYGLEGLARGVGLAGILKVRVFKMYSINELEDSLKRPTVMGAKFKLALFDRKQLGKIGLEVGDEPPPAAINPPADNPEATVVPDGAADDKAEDASLEAGLALLANANGKADKAPERVPDKPDVAKSTTYLFVGADHAAQLLGRVPLEELTAPKLMSLNNSLAVVMDMATSMTVDESADLHDLVDSIDILLAKALESGAVNKLGFTPLRPEGEGMRPVTKHMTLVKLAIAEFLEPIKVAEKRSEGVGGAGSGGSEGTVSESMLAKLVSASAGNQRLTEKEEKVAEQLSASQTRLEIVSKNHEAVALLRDLAKVAESDIGDDKVLSAYETAANANVHVAQLLKSSQVKAPRGDEVLLNPLASECVTHVRAARNGVMRAAKAQMRRLLTPAADVAVLVDNAWAGDMRGNSGVDVASLGKPSSAKAWLDVPASSATGESQKTHMLTTLLVAQPAITQVLTMLQPSDKTISKVLAEAFSSMAKGIRSSSVTEAVECILVPLMRAYHEAWDLFQKSASMSMPSMLAVWTREKLEPATASYLTRTGTLAAGGGGGNNGGGVTGAELSAVKRELQSLKSQIKATAPPKVLKSIADKSDDELTPDELAKRVENREKRAAKALKYKEQKE